MKNAFILATLILAFSVESNAEIWKCQKEGEKAASYTDTPTGGEGINCEKVETIRFTKTNENSPKAAAPSRRYSAPAPHVVTKVKRAVKSTPRAPREEKKSSSSGKSGGNHPSGIK